MPRPYVEVTEFSTDDFRKVGAVAEFNPEWLSGKSAALAGRPVRVVKVNPKSIKVETEDGVVVTTDALMLVPTDKPFTAAAAERPVAGSLVTVDPRVHLRGEQPGQVWVALGAPAVDGKVMVARLGGNKGRYYTIPARSLTVIPAAEVLA